METRQTLPLVDKYPCSSKCLLYCRHLEAHGTSWPSHHPETERFIDQKNENNHVTVLCHASFKVRRGLVSKFLVSARYSYWDNNIKRNFQKLCSYIFYFRYLKPFDRLSTLKKPTTFLLWGDLSIQNVQSNCNSNQIL